VLTVVAGFADQASSGAAVALSWDPTAQRWR